MPTLGVLPWLERVDGTFLAHDGCLVLFAESRLDGKTEANGALDGFRNLTVFIFRLQKEFMHLLSSWLELLLNFVAVRFDFGRAG